LKKFLIIGGSDAGISAALRARELDPNVEVTMVLADRYPNFSICGLPFYLSGEVPDWRNLAHRTLAEIEHQKICVLTEHVAEKIDPATKTILVKGELGHPKALHYDKLMIGTGAVSIRPPIHGLDLPGVFFLRWMNDSFQFKKYFDTKDPKSITIIGAGYIGMEMADAMRHRGLIVNVVEYFPEVLMTVDPSLGSLVRSELERQSVNVFTGVSVTEIELKRQTLFVKGRDGFEVSSDMVLVATGCRPQTTLAQAARITLGVKDAIQVNRKMETSHPDIYAAGDCAETYHCLLNRNIYLPLGTTAHKQGRIAGENAIGGNCKYAGSLGTQSVKIFELVVARTGLKDDEARSEDFEPITTDFESWDHKIYYPNAKRMHIRMTGDRKSHHLLGAQIVGAYGTEVSKRIDIIATAIYNKLTIDDLNQLDLSYTPPLSSPWDPVQMAAQEWMRLLKN
jgi:NADPH-dependent 2,4-dienoyl-CoA reductase/sulfur reductase-like enzyme